MKINICKVLFEDLKLKARYSEKIRGYIGSKYNEFLLLHNHYGTKFIYRYPKVQYKIIKNVPIIIGIEEAANLVANIGIFDDELILDKTRYISFEKKIIMDNLNLEEKDDYLMYKFMTPWVALNQSNIRKYRLSNEIERENMLKNILIGNIISLCKGLNYTINKKLDCWINLKEIDVKLKGIKYKAFMGEFKVNFEIPEYLGIGKFVSKGFGTIKRK